MNTTDISVTNKQKIPPGDLEGRMGTIAAHSYFLHCVKNNQN